MATDNGSWRILVDNVSCIFSSQIVVEMDQTIVCLIWKFVLKEGLDLKFINREQLMSKKFLFEIKLT